MVGVQNTLFACKLGVEHLLTFNSTDCLYVLFSHICAPLTHHTLTLPPHTQPTTEAEKFLLSESALDDIDLTDDQYALASNKNNKDIDFDALLEARMLDEVRVLCGWCMCVETVRAREMNRGHKRAVLGACGFRMPRLVLCVQDISHNMVYCKSELLQMDPIMACELCACPATAAGVVHFTSIASTHHNQGTAAVMNVGDEDVMSGFATLLPGAEGDEEEGGAGERRQGQESWAERLLFAAVSC